MTAPAAVGTCTCGHPKSEHNLRRPDGGCGACTQCYSLNAHIPHTWHRCRCLAFDDAAIRAELAGDIEVLDPPALAVSTWLPGDPTGGNHATD